MNQQMLTKENYAKGMLIDDECIGGVSEHPEKKELFVAYVMNHLTAEYLNYGEFARVEEALQALNSVNRPWKFEKSGGCGGCGGEGACGGGDCSTGGGCGDKCGTEDSCGRCDD